MSPRTASAPQATWLVAKREILSQVRSKSFIISSAILVILVFAASVFAGYMSDRGISATQVAVVPETESVLASNPMVTVEVVPDEAAARAQVMDESVDAAIVPDSDPESVLGYKLLALDSAPQTLQLMTSITPPVELLVQPEEGDTGGGAMDYVMAMLFGMVFMIPVITFGSVIAQNTVVEKQTRTVELLVSAVSPRVLLAGKVLGNSALAIGQTLAVLLAGVLGLVVMNQTMYLSMLSAPMLWFAVFFVFGFVLFAAIFAASASLVSRIEDTGSVLSPVMMLAMTPYFVVILFGQNPLVMSIASFVPFTSPVAMSVRVLQSGVPIWEPLLSLLILVATDFLVIVVAARIYQASVLKTGKRIKLKEAWAGDRG